MGEYTTSTREYDKWYIHSSITYIFLRKLIKSANVQMYWSAIK